jgi:hypothetical protein
MVEFIKYNDEELPVRVSYFAISMVKKKTGKSLSAVQDEDYDLYEALLFYALMQGHTITKKPFNFVLEDMPQILDQCFVDFLKIIPKFFSQMQEVSAKPVTKEDVEKK